MCTCWNQPSSVLSNFDTSLELSKDGTLESDPLRVFSSGFDHSSTAKVRLAPFLEAGGVILIYKVQVPSHFIVCMCVGRERVGIKILLGIKWFL